MCITQQGWRTHRVGTNLVTPARTPIAETTSGSAYRYENLWDKWSGRVDLNHRPPGPEPGALARLSHAPTSYSLNRRAGRAQSVARGASKGAVKSFRSPFRRTRLQRIRRHSPQTLRHAPEPVHHRGHCGPAAVLSSAASKPFKNDPARSAQPHESCRLLSSLGTGSARTPAAATERRPPARPTDSREEWRSELAAPAPAGTHAAAGADQGGTRPVSPPPEELR